MNGSCFGVAKKLCNRIKLILMNEVSEFQPMRGDFFMSAKVFNSNIKRLIFIFRAIIWR